MIILTGGGEREGETRNGDEEEIGEHVQVYLHAYMYMYIHICASVMHVHYSTCV